SYWVSAGLCRQLHRHLRRRRLCLVRLGHHVCVLPAVGALAEVARTRPRLDSGGILATTAADWHYATSAGWRPTFACTRTGNTQPIGAWGSRADRARRGLSG